MTKIARFIVDKRKAFYLIFIAAFLFCAASINKVQINNDITSYLPAQTETRQGPDHHGGGIHHVGERQCDGVQRDL